MYIIYCYATNHPLKLMAWATPIFLNFRKHFSFNCVCCVCVSVWRRVHLAAVPTDAVPTGARLQAVVSSLVWELEPNTGPLQGRTHSQPQRCFCSPDLSHFICFQANAPAIWAGVWLVLLPMTLPGLFMWLQPPAASTQLPVREFSTEEFFDWTWCCPPTGSMSCF